MHEQLLSFQSSILSVHTLFFCSACRHEIRQSRRPHSILVRFSSSLVAHAMFSPVGRWGGRFPCRDWPAASPTRWICERTWRCGTGDVEDVLDASACRGQCCVGGWTMLRVLLWGSRRASVVRTWRVGCYGVLWEMFMYKEHGYGCIACHTRN